MKLSNSGNCFMSGLMSDYSKMDPEEARRDFQDRLKQYESIYEPVDEELDLKKAARAAGRKRLEMLPSKQLLPMTGYIHGGCSPLGMKKVFPSWIDETAILYDSIYVSGGRVGTNLRVSPFALSETIHAEFLDLIRV